MTCDGMTCELLLTIHLILITHHSQKYRTYPSGYLLSFFFANIFLYTAF